MGADKFQGLLAAGQEPTVTQIHLQTSFVTLMSLLFPSILATITLIKLFNSDTKCVIYISCHFGPKIKLRCNM